MGSDGNVDREPKPPFPGREKRGRTYEAHEHRNAGRETRPLVDCPPDFRAGRKAREPALGTVRPCGNEDDDDDKGDEVERGAARVDLREPFRWQRGHDGVQDHDEDGQEERLVLGRDVGRVLDRRGGEDHGGDAVVDFFEAWVSLLSSASGWVLWT